MLNDTLIISKKTFVICNHYNDSIVSNLSHNLTQRIDNVENLDIKFILPIVVSILIPLVNWIVVKYSYKKDKQSRILNELVNQYEITENVFVETYDSKKSKTFKNYLLEKVLNKIENACYEYNKGNVDKKDFNHTFKYKIESYYETFPEYYRTESTELSSYNDTIKYYNKLNKKK